jgi:hypothetical protein
MLTLLVPRECPPWLTSRGIEEMRVTAAGMQAAAYIEQCLADTALEPWAIAVIAPQETCSG